MAFPVFEVDEWQAYAEEQMGTKRKIWFLSPDGAIYLFKYPRPGSGEAWAEKLAAEVAEVIRVPHAEVELATFQGEQGTMCKSFMTDPSSDLFHGNQLLRIIHPSYDTQKNAGQSEHTYQRVTRIISALETTAPSPCLTDGVTCFAGYLTLDALIGNSDRHHENWALILSFGREDDGSPLVASSQLAPSFDHASCLGRELSDEQRKSLLEDSQRLHRYFARCRSRVYWEEEEDQRQLHPTELVRRGYAESPDLFRPWLDTSVTMGDNTVCSLLDSIPPDWMSDEAREFAAALVRLNRSALADIREETVK